jgi:hypothetical protein
VLHGTRNLTPDEQAQLLANQVYEDAFDANPGGRGWDVQARLLTNGVAKAAYIIPVVGYVILYSDYFSSLFHFAALSPAHWVVLSPRMRLYLIYYGSLLLLLAYVAYLLTAPSLLKDKTSRSQFVSEVLSTNDHSTTEVVLRESIERVKAVRPGYLAKDKDDRLSAFLRNMIDRQAHFTFTPHNANAIPNALHFYYNWKNRSEGVAQAVIYLVIVASYLMLLAPALDIFSQVVQVTYHSLAWWIREGGN